MTIYLIGIGGSGAKCIEAALHLGAVGLLTTEPIKILFIDTDEANGNIERARNTLAVYQKCDQLINKTISAQERENDLWLKTPVEKSYDIWPLVSNLGNRKNLESVFEYQDLKKNNPNIASLFDLLFSKDEQQISLDSGFKGRADLASLMISRMDLETETIWQSLKEDIKNEREGRQNPRIFLFGSIFGGTGAAVIPTLPQLIADDFPDLKIASVFLLPYFEYRLPSYVAPNAIYARPEMFLLNTANSLRHYLGEAQKAFSAIYILGSPHPGSVKFSPEQREQRNPAHFLELYAALALRHYLLYLDNHPPVPGTVLLMSRRQTGKLYWEDLPESLKVKQSLSNGVRFAYAWLNGLVPSLKLAKEQGIPKFQRVAPWFIEFFRPQLPPSIVFFNSVLGLFPELEHPNFNDPEQQTAITMVSNWCHTYFRWLAELHTWEGEEINLFEYKLFANSSPPTDFTNPINANNNNSINVMKRITSSLKDIANLITVNDNNTNFANLIIADERDKASRAQDTMQQLKAQLATQSSKGVDGLAKALYRQCRF